MQLQIFCKFLINNKYASDLCTYMYEHKFIPHVMAYVACIGVNREHCDTVTGGTRSNMEGVWSGLVFIAVCFWSYFV